MAIFNVTITDPAQLDGISAAREAYNGALPEDGVPLETNDEYVQFVMARAAESYANQYGTA